jgi:hypothetical protein
MEMTWHTTSLRELARLINPYSNSNGFGRDISPFITAFSNSFMAMALYGNPNYRYTTGDITPSWNSWPHGFTEMIFNKTSMGLPNVYTSQTDKALRERCK